MSTLPTDAQARKAIPVATGFVDYFPDAMAVVAELSRIGNDQHNPGKPLHWDRSKSGDESDALMRHFLQRGTLDSDGIRHSAKVAWRAMALLQKELENEREEELARRSIPPLEYPAVKEWALMEEGVIEVVDPQSYFDAEPEGYVTGDAHPSACGSDPSLCADCPNREECGS